MYITLRINSHLTVKKEQKSEVPEPTHTYTQVYTSYSSVHSAYKKSILCIQKGELAC